ncbi:MAG: PH domain-containing protein [Saprospiraceae bacterium]|nr:PH domain-containing protein [Saprospiraceae bacterium]
MKKNRHIDFSQPMMQSYAAILLIMYQFYKILIRQLFPLLIIVLIQRKWMNVNRAMFFIIPFAAVGAKYGIVAFFRYRFYIKGGKLIVNKGVFKRSKVEIPLERIQSVNFEQNIIHRLFNVVRLNLDTAGSAKNELELHALDKDIAEALSHKVLSFKKKMSASIDKQEHFQERKKEEIFRLGFGQLIKVGLTENHIRSGGIILFFFIWLFDNLRDIGLDMYEKTEEYLPQAEVFLQSLFVVVLLLILFFLSSMAISMIRTVLQYYQLHMYRSAGGFIIRSGLLNKKENAAKDQKIQIFKWTQNLLQYWTGIYKLNLRQASSVQVSDKSSLRVIGLSQSDVVKSRNYVFRDFIDDIDRLEHESVNVYYFLRRFLIWSYLFIPFIFISFYIDSPVYPGYIIFLYAFVVLSTYFSFRKKRYAIGEEMISLRGGTFGNSQSLMAIYKIQSVRMRSTPFQRRRGLATLEIFSASGGIQIPEIKTHIANTIRDYILYKVERSRRNWM